MCVKLSSGLAQSHLVECQTILRLLTHLVLGLGSFEHMSETVQHRQLLGQAEGKDFHQHGILRYKSARSDTRTYPVFQTFATCQGMKLEETRSVIKAPLLQHTATMSMQPCEKKKVQRAEQAGTVQQ
jgi:hypothetical protein